MLSAEVCSTHIWAFIQNVLTDCPLGIHKQAGKVDLGGTSQKGCSKVVKMFKIGALQGHLCWPPLQKKLI